MKRERADGRRLAANPSRSGIKDKMKQDEKISTHRGECVSPSLPPSCPKKSLMQETSGDVERFERGSSTDVNVVFLNA